MLLIPRNTFMSWCNIHYIKYEQNINKWPSYVWSVFSNQNQICKIILTSHRLNSISISRYNLSPINYTKDNHVLNLCQYVRKYT